MRIPAIVTAVCLVAAPALVAQRGAAPKVANPVVIQFMVDGIDHNSVRTAIAARRDDARIVAEARRDGRNLLLHEPCAAARSAGRLAAVGRQHELERGHAHRHAPVRVVQHRRHFPEREARGHQVGLRRRIAQLRDLQERRLSLLRRRRADRRDRGRSRVCST